MTGNLATSCKNTRESDVTLAGGESSDLQLSIFSFPDWDMIIVTGNYRNYISPLVNHSNPLTQQISKWLQSSHKEQCPGKVIKSNESNSRIAVGRLEMGDRFYYEKRSHLSSFIELK